MASQPLSPAKPEPVPHSLSGARPVPAVPATESLLGPWIAGLAGALVLLSFLGGAMRGARTARSHLQIAAPPSAVSVPVPTAAAELPETATLTSLRYSSKPAFTAIELELDRPVAVLANTLHNPERVYFDLSDTGIGAALKPQGMGTFKLPVGAGLVRRIRMAENGKSGTRVVLDLSESCRYAFIMATSPPYRLVIDVEPQHPADMKP